MTSRERINTVLFGGTPDRVPVSLYKINPFDTNCFWAQHASFNNLLAKAREVQDTFHLYRPKTGFFFSAPEAIEVKVKEFQDSPISRVVELEVETSLGPLTRTARTTRMSSYEWVQKPWIENRQDIEKFLTLPYVPCPLDLSEFFRYQEKLGEKGVAVLALPDPVGVVGMLFAPGDFAKVALDHIDLIHQLLEKMQERLISVYSFVSRQVSNTIIRIRGAEYVTPPILPPEYFRHIKKVFSDLVIRYDMPLIETLRQGQRNFVCYHWHEQTSELIPLVMKLEPDIIEPICNSYEIPNTVLRVRKAVGDSITLMGGISAEDLEFRSPEEINVMVKDVLAQGSRRGRFILIPANVPTSAPLSPLVETNYLEFLKAGVFWGAGH